MPENDLILRFRFATSADLSHANDMRTSSIKQVKTIDGQESETELYKFYHPVIQGLHTGVTNYHRINDRTGRWDPAGTIDWHSDTSCNVFFGGTEKVHIRELRKSKKSTSKSRRFKANGSEYKWKVAENGQDMTCTSQQLTAYGKIVAEWSQATLTLRVAERAEPILDRLVVTLILNLWMRSLNDW